MAVQLPKEIAVAIANMGYTDFQAASGTVLAQSTLIASVPTAESTSTKVSAAATESTSTKVMAFFI